MPSTPERLASIEAALERIELAVSGDGSKGSSLRERVAGLESSNDWKHRAVFSVFPSLVTAVLTQFGLHLPVQHS